MVKTISAPLPCHDTTEMDRSSSSSMTSSTNMSESIISTSWPLSAAGAPLEAAPAVVTAPIAAGTTVVASASASASSSMASASGVAAGSGPAPPVAVNAEPSFYLPEAMQLDPCIPSIVPRGAGPIGSDVPAAFVTVALSINISTNGIYASNCSSPAVTLPVASSAVQPSVNGFNFPADSAALAPVAMVTNPAGIHFIHFFID